jgi:hypothetical protein
VSASAGQFGPVPGHVSAGSQTPADERQTTLVPANPSAGQSLLVPLQLSGTSQTPADDRHTAVLFTSAGH